MKPRLQQLNCHVGDSPVRLSVICARHVGLCGQRNHSHLAWLQLFLTTLNSAQTADGNSALCFHSITYIEALIGLQVRGNQVRPGSESAINETMFHMPIASGSLLTALVLGCGRVSVFSAPFHLYSKGIK